MMRWGRIMEIGGKVSISKYIFFLTLFLKNKIIKWELLKLKWEYKENKHIKYIHIFSKKRKDDKNLSVFIYIYIYIY